MAGPSECPSAETLTSFVFGKLPPEQSDVVNVHVEQCAACGAHVYALEQQSEAVIHARRPAVPGEVSATQRLPVAPLAPAAPGGAPRSAPRSAPFLIDGYDILAEIGRGG